MKALILLALATLSLSAFGRVCPAPWVCAQTPMRLPYTNIVGKIFFSDAVIRSGYLPERAPFRGNVMYFEGLGDSMLNHAPLFNKLTEAGFRVIAFDYMGQGGSTGSMNRTRIQYIPEIAKMAWSKWANPKVASVSIIGWSTGGLAAYLATATFRIDKVVLIAPGIVPKFLVGEGLTDWPLNHITIETLTTDRYNSRNSDPHVDPIKPESPLLVRDFALDLISQSKTARRMTISGDVQGFVLLSGDEDTYVKANGTRNILARNARHFIVKTYVGSLHEIDNERADIRNLAHADIIKFLTNNF